MSSSFRMRRMRVRVILWVTTQTQLFLAPPIFSPCRGSGLSSLRRLILKKEGLSGGPPFSKRWQIFPTGCSMIFEGLPCPVDRSWCAQRCCDGAATESLLRRRCAELRRAYSARRVRDGADAAATELMLRAALLRRSCADQLRRAHSAHRVSTRRAE